MSKARIPTGSGEMRPEYDFSNAVRGKYYERFKASSNVVVLDPDVSAAFPNAEAVNQALRVLASVAHTRVHAPKRVARSTRRPNKGMKLTKPGRR